MTIGALWNRRHVPLTGSTSAAIASDSLAPGRPAQVNPSGPGLPQAAAEQPIDAAAAGHAAYAASDYVGALAAYQAAVERNPRDADAWSNMGQVLVRLDRTPEAIPCFNRAIEIAPDRWTHHFNLARARALLEQWDAAIESYRRADGLFPDDYATLFNLGLTLHKKGDEPAAVDAYQRAIALAPDDATFRLALAISLDTLQRNADAATAYSEYLRLFPGAPDADKVHGRIEALWVQAGAVAAPVPISGTPAKPGGR